MTFRPVRRDRGNLCRVSLGVDFFFVLSGFIILNAHWNDNRSLESSRIFLLKRFIRVYPPYWPVSIALLLAYAALPSFSAGSREEISLAKSLLLVPSSAPPALSVAWTLVHEMFFYCVFLIFFLSSRLFAGFCLAWLLLMINTIIYSPQYSNPLLKLAASPINIEFLAGMLCAITYKKIRSALASAALVTAGALLLIFFCTVGIDQEYRFIYCLPFFLMVLGASSGSLYQKIKLPESLVFLGDASYSIYLVHNPFLSIASRMTAKMMATWEIALVMLVFLCAVAGSIYHLMIEKPLIRWCSRRLLKKPRPA